MAYPSVAARTATQITTAASSHSIGLGAPAAGELLLVIFNVRNNPTLVIDESVSGKRWHGRVFGDGSTTERMAVLWKVAQGSDALTILTDSAERSASVCYRITGHGSAVTVSTFSTASSTNGDPPNCAQSGAAQDTLWLAALGTVTSVASAAPAGYSSLTTASATSIFLSTAEKTANAASEDPGVFTNTNQRWVGVTIAVASAAITTNTRATQATVETLSQVDPNAVITQVSLEVLSANALQMHVTQVAVEVLSSNDDLGSSDNALLMLII